MSTGAALTYDDILIVPQYSEVPSRSSVDTTSQLTRNLSIERPIISANMDCVTGADMATAMSEVGGVGVIHRFMHPFDQACAVTKAKEQGAKLVGVAVGIKGDFLERAVMCVDAGADFLVLDVAHGHTLAVKTALELIKEIGPDVVVGNVATQEGARFLAEAGADAIKVGVGPGASCLTRIVAGVGVPQFSAVVDCSLVCSEYDIPVIADGGVRYPGDVAKAIAAGASTVMVGSLLARAKESPGELIKRDGKLYKRFRGMASQGAMDVAKEIHLTSSNGSSPE